MCMKDQDPDVLESSSASELDKKLYCSVCLRKFGEKNEVKGSPSDGFFTCHRSFHMSHYGPSGYAIDKNGIEYTYDEDGNIVHKNSKWIRKFKKLNIF